MVRANVPGVAGTPSSGKGLLREADYCLQISDCRNGHRPASDGP